MITVRTSPAYVNRVRQDWTANGGVYGDGGVYAVVPSNDPFAQLGPTLDLTFAGVPTDQLTAATADGYSINLNLSSEIYQIAAQYTVWTATGLTQVNFADVVTFTRGSNATQFDSTGSLVYAPVNLLTWSEDFGNAAWTKQASVSIATNTTVAPNGTTTGDTVTADSGFGVFQQLAVTVGTQVTQSVYLRAGTATAIMFRDDTGAGRHIVVNPSTGAITSTSGTLLNSGSVSVGNGWYRIFFSYTADSTLVRNIIRPDSAGAAQTFIVWGGQTSLFPTLGGVTADFATYYPTTTTAYYGPRFDFNPSTLAAQGLLIEEQRTNSIRNNTMQGAVAGTPGTLPTNWSTFFAPTGVTRTVVGTGVQNGITYIDVRYSGTPSAATEISIYPEAAASLLFSAGAVVTWGAYLAIVAGATTNITGAFLRTLSYNGGTYLSEGTSSNLLGGLTATMQRSNFANYTVAATADRVVAALSLYATAGAAIDITLRIGLPQLELGAFATSVIPTTTTALTRNADVASVNTLSPWYNASEGTIYFEGSTTNTAEAPFFTLQNGGVTDFIRSSRSSNQSRLLVLVASGTVADLYSGNTITLGTIFKAAGAYKVNDFANVLNAGTPVVDTSGAVPTVTTLQLGSGGFLGSLGGYIRRITYYPRRLPNADLQTITA